MSCGLGTCTNPTCYLCTVVAKLPQPAKKLAPDPEPDALIDVAPDVDAFAFERAAKYAVPDASRKKDAKHPMFTKRNRKALEAPGLRLRK